MSDEEIMDMARAYLGFLKLNLNDPERVDNAKMMEFERLMNSDDHCRGLTIGFCRGYRACEAIRMTPTLQPGSN